MWRLFTQPSLLGCDLRPRWSWSQSGFSPEASHGVKVQDFVRVGHVLFNTNLLSDKCRPCWAKEFKEWAKILWSLFNGFVHENIITLSVHSHKIYLSIWQQAESSCDFCVAWRVSEHAGRSHSEFWVCLQSPGLKYRSGQLFFFVQVFRCTAVGNTVLSEHSWTSMLHCPSVAMRGE